MQIIQLTQKYSIIIYPLEYLAMKVINSSNWTDEYLSSMYTQKFKSETETKRIRKILDLKWIGWVPNSNSTCNFRDNYCFRPMKSIKIILKVTS